MRIRLYSDLHTEFMNDHSHRSNDFFIGPTRVLSNPRGYDSGDEDETEEERLPNREFDPGLTFNVQAPITERNILDLTPPTH